VPDYTLAGTNKNKLTAKNDPNTMNFSALRSKQLHSASDWGFFGPLMHHPANSKYSIAPA
jgi:hypothetical protein